MVQHDFVYSIDTVNINIGRIRRVYGTILVAGPLRLNAETDTETIV